MDVQIILLIIFCLNSVAAQPQPPEVDLGTAGGALSEAPVSLNDDAACGLFRTAPPPDWNPLDRSAAAARVLNGLKTYQGQFPWTACIRNSLVLIDSRDAKSDLRRFKGYAAQSCSASIIRPNWILTAAHCTKDKLKQLRDGKWLIEGMRDEHKSYVIAGSTLCAGFEDLINFKASPANFDSFKERLNQVMPGVQIRKVIARRPPHEFASVFEHNMYLRGFAEKDIALIKLFNPLKNLPMNGIYANQPVNTVCIDGAPRINTMCNLVHFAGFGCKFDAFETEESERPKEVESKLTSVTTKEVAKAICDAHTKNEAQKLTTYKCFAHELQTDPRNPLGPKILRVIQPGDSGGPFVIYSKNASEAGPSTSGAATAATPRGVQIAIESQGLVKQSRAAKWGFADLKFDIRYSVGVSIALHLDWIKRTIETYGRNLISLPVPESTEGYRDLLPGDV